jgi:NADH-quinone oxidoreductase subunit N
MYINKSDDPIPAFRTDGYTRAALAVCTLGIIALSFAGVVYQWIDGFAWGV